MEGATRNQSKTSLNAVKMSYWLEVYENACVIAAGYANVCAHAAGYANGCAHAAGYANVCAHAHATSFW